MNEFTYRFDLILVSSSDENEPNTQMEIFAPLESDLEESANSAPEHQVSLILCIDYF